MENQLLSETSILAFGQYYADIQQLATPLEDEISPLYKCDVLDCDQQDFIRVYRKFSAATLGAALKSEECTVLLCLE